MKTVACWIAKGGTGKSSTAGNLAFYLRAHGRVLLVDADPQANITGWIHPETFTSELTDVLAGRAVLSETILPIREGLDLLPSFAIGGGLKIWAETVLPGHPFAFQDFRTQVEQLGYSYLLYDMSPGASFLERSIISSVDEVLPVVRPEVFSFDGLEVFRDTLEAIRRDLRATATAPRLVVNGLNRSIAVHRTYFDELGQQGFELFTIGQNSKVCEAQTYHTFLAEHETDNRSLPEYRRLAEAVA
jgi:chromosome partitioning protein